MAKAIRKVIEREVTTVVKDELVVLELTREEALTLRIVVGSVGGNSTTSRRKDTDSILIALGGVGITANSVHVHYPTLGSLFFKEEIGR